VDETRGGRAAQDVQIAHPRKVFKKLGISSRRELRGAVASSATL
jgi:hypothetical protein